VGSAISFAIRDLGESSKAACDPQGSVWSILHISASSQGVLKWQFGHSSWNCRAEAPVTGPLSLPPAVSSAAHAEDKAILRGKQWAVLLDPGGQRRRW
jgi:hypothetical protein